MWTMQFQRMILTQLYINTRLTQSILTPKIGYRLIDADHFKFDFLGGMRYWYVSVNNTLYPSGLGMGDRSTLSMAWVAAGSYCPLVKRQPSR